MYGSFERFMGILIEHYAGHFPTWLAPVQCTVINISDRHLEYAQKVVSMLEEKGIRVELDARSETMNYRIREAQLQKIPYMLVVGDKESEANGVGVRHFKDGDLGILGLEDFVNKIVEEATMEF